MGGVSARGKGVGGVAVDDIDAGLGQPGPHRQSCNQAVQHRRLALIDLSGAAHFQGQLVAEPVGEKIHG